MLITAGSALFLFSLLALGTSHPGDPSLLTFSSQPQNHNVVGFVGATFSDLLFELLGPAAYLVPGFLLHLVWIQVKARRTPIRTYGGWALLFLSVPPILTGSLSSAWSSPFPSGGSTGAALYGIARARLNPGGAYLLFVTVLLLGLIVLSFDHLHRFEERIRDRWRLRKAADKTVTSPPALPEPVRTVSESAAISVMPPDPVQLPTKGGAPNRAPVLPFDDFGDDGLSIPAIGHDGDAFRFRPPDSLLDPLPPPSEATSPQFLKETERNLTEFFVTYGVPGRIVGHQTGPVVTMFEFQPAPGIKVNRVTGLANELSMVLKVPHIHIQVPVPGKSAVGLEIPNPIRQTVGFREIFQSPNFRAITSPLALALGKNINGEPVASDLSRMPHLLIAGATGTGKSVCLNVLIASILMNSGPDDVRLIMIDPKRLEFAPYEGIPHLIGPVVTDPRFAAMKLRMLNEEMLRRYDTMKTAGVRNIGEFRKSRPQSEWFPYIVVLIDELADLMLSLKKDVEPQIIRLAQMSRASGIHLVLATQRPSAQVLTGLIKANIPTKIAFQVTTQIDSRVILDQGGAELLLGAGDMLMRPPGTDSLRRLHGAFISEGEINRIVDAWKTAIPAQEGDEDLLSHLSTESPAERDDSGDSEIDDELYDEAVQVVKRQGRASTSLIQRHLRIGYNRAARMIERMESEGIIGRQEGSRPRPVLDRTDPDESI